MTNCFNSVNNTRMGPDCNLINVRCMYVDVRTIQYV